MRAKELEYPDFEQQQLDFENQKLNFDLISDNCQQYLQGMRQAGRCLFRGIRGTREVATNQSEFVNSSKPNRLTMHSDIPAQNKFDKYLKKLDVKALRSNSTFVTSDFSMAGEFGNIYAIFPFDNCPFAWSRKFKDIILHNEDLTAVVKRISFNSVYNPPGSDSTVEHEELHRFIDYYQIDDNDLVAAIRSRHEIWFTGKYVGIRWQLNEEAILKFIGVN